MSGFKNKKQNKTKNKRIQQIQIRQSPINILKQQKRCFPFPFPPPHSLLPSLSFPLPIKNHPQPCPQPPYKGQNSPSFFTFFPSFVQFLSKYLPKSVIFFFFILGEGGRGGVEGEREGGEVGGGEGVGEGVVGFKEEGELVFFCVDIGDEEENIY